jgi:hypothetical protein
MIRIIHVWLWGIFAELEYYFYPWKNNNPPEWAVKRYNIDTRSEDQDLEFEQELNFEWLKHHQDKIATLQLEMIYITEQVNKLIDENNQKNT